MMDTPALLVAFESGLPAEDVVTMRSMAFAGEDGEFAVQLLAALADERIPVSSAERDVLARLVAETGKGADDLSRLVVADAR